MPVVDGGRRPVDPGGEIVSQPDHHQTGGGIEQDDVAVRAPAPGQDLAHDDGVGGGVGTPQVLELHARQPEVDGVDRPPSHTRRQARCPAIGVVGGAGRGIGQAYAERMALLDNPGQRHEQRLADGRWVMIEERRTSDGGWL